MRLYTFGCKDSYSDDGTVTIVVADTTIRAAKAKVTQLLKSKGRHELIELIAFKGITKAPEFAVVFENVEEWHPSREELNARDLEAAG